MRILVFECGFDPDTVMAWPLSKVWFWVGEATAHANEKARTR